MANSKQRRMNFMPKGRSLQLQDDEELPDDEWEHYYAHRDRRDLYRRMETASPL